MAEISLREVANSSIRKKAAVRFAKNLDIRNEFRTIIIRRRKKAEGESEPETEE